MKNFNNSIHHKESIRYSRWKQIEYLYDFHSIFSDKIVQQSFSVLDIPQGNFLCLIYVNNLLHTISTIGKKSSKPKDITAFYKNCLCIPKQLPSNIFPKRVIKIYGTITLSVIDWINLQIAFPNDIRAKSLSTFLASCSKCKKKTDIVTTLFQQLQFFPHNTNLVQRDFAIEFVSCMKAFGFQLASKVRTAVLTIDPKSKKSIYSLESIKENIAIDRKIFIDAVLFEWKCVVFVVNDVTKWDYSFVRYYSRYGFTVSYPNERRQTIVTKIHFVSNRDMVVLEHLPVRVESWNVTKTNVVSYKEILQKNIRVGSKIVVSTKNSGAPIFVMDCL